MEEARECVFGERGYCDNQGKQERVWEELRKLGVRCGERVG